MTRQTGTAVLRQQFLHNFSIQFSLALAPHLEHCSAAAAGVLAAAAGGTAENELYISTAGGWTNEGGGGDPGDSFGLKNEHRFPVLVSKSGHYQIA